MLLQELTRTPFAPPSEYFASTAIDYHVQHAVGFPTLEFSTIAMTAKPNGNSSFVQKISKLVLENDFPLKVSVEIGTSEASDLKEYLDTRNLRWRVEKLAIEVELSDTESKEFVNYIHAKWNYLLDYSAFECHPGLLTVRGYGKSAEELRGEIYTRIKFKLLSDVKAEKDSFTVKFDNHLDAYQLLSQFNSNSNSDSDSNLNLHVSRYTKNLPGSNDDPVVYDTIVVENLHEFGTLSLLQFEKLMLKFTLFLPIETVFFPLANKEENLRFKKVGFIGLPQNQETNSRLLNALYYLTDLTLLELLDFSQKDIYDLARDLNTRERENFSKSPKLKLSIAQRKHNHHLYENSDSPYICFRDGAYQLAEPDLGLHESEYISRFVKSSNYQETNVYVNNFPIIFNNDDRLWAEFWNQFGADRIKSAKIIKPQFYLKKLDGSLGKIGFVFYEEFKMALRAIILTNNKVIRYDDSPSLLIQASFAIQKNSSHSQLVGKPQKFHQNLLNYYPEALLPKQFGNASPFVPMPDQYMFNPYMMLMPPYGVTDKRFEEQRGDLGVANSFPPQYGYYFPYMPYSGQVPGPIPPPIYIPYEEEQDPRS